MRDYITVAKAVADPTRVRILKMLEGGELCVCHIAERLGLAQSTVSKHLSLLRHAALVDDRKQGLWVYYRLAEDSDDGNSTAFLRLVRSSLNDDPVVIGDKTAPRTCCDFKD